MGSNNLRSSLLVTSAATLVAATSCGEDPSSSIQRAPAAPVVTQVVATLDPADIAAGDVTSVTCTGTFSDGRTEALTADAVRIRVDPSASVKVEGLSVTAKEAGTFTVTCEVEGVDTSESATLVVVPTDAERIIALVEPSETRAGASVNVTCVTEDAFGNRAAAPDADVRTSPSRDVSISERSVVAEKAGEYEVECRLGRLERVAAALTVLPAEAARIIAEATPRSPLAGEPVEVTCSAVDAFANPVEVTTELRVDPAPTSLEATRFAAEIAGSYDVTCALPGSSAQSEALTVVVQPNLPATVEFLSVTPDLPIYASGDTIVPAVQVSDTYGNIVENPQVRFYGRPSGSVTDLGQQLVLLGDGTITIVAAVEPPTQLNRRVEATRDVVVDGLAPEVNVTFPARGSMVSRDPSQSLTIRGTVTDNLSSITDLVVNGAPVRINSSGSFSVPMSPSWGTNLIEISAVDAAGNVRQVAQSFHLATNYRRVNPFRTVSGRIADGVVAHLGQPALDDDSSDVDDLATIARLAIENTDVASLIPNPATTYDSRCWFTDYELDLHVDDVRFGRPSIDLESRSGGLYASISIPNLVTDIRTTGHVCGIPVNVSGSATASRITVSGFLAVSTSNGRVTVTMPTAAVSITSVRVNLNLPAAIDWAVDGIINLFRGMIADRLESAFRDVIREEVPAVAQDFLRSLDLSTSFDLPAPLSTQLSVSSGISSTFFNFVGGRLGLATSIYAPRALSQEPVGGILRETSYLPNFSTSTGLGVGLSYDLLNQALYSAWYGGALNLDLSEFFDGQLDSGGQSLQLEAIATPLLPPILRPSGNANYPIEIQLGDLGMDLDITGIPNLPPVQSTIYAHVVVRANVTVDSAGNIQLAIAPNPDLTLDVQSSLDVLVDPGALRAALEGIVNAYLPRIVGDVLGGIPLPTFDVSSMAGSYLPPNIVLGLGNAQTRFHSSYVILEGSLVRR